MKRTTLFFQIPADIPLPDFDLFQPVQWDDYRGTATGTVIGMYWVDHNTALMAQIEPGWHYMVSRIFGVTDTRVVLKSSWEHEMLAEEKLFAIEGATA
ncbi:MAG: hypothetical protein AAF773_00045 [Cyanobacteria bacterium P01_D01_bin.115]